MERPADLGFRMPAEWEPHDAVWFSWPHPDTESFPGAYARIPQAFGALVRAAAEFEPVRVNVRNAAEETEQIVRNLEQWLGVRNVLWLGDGIEGDDTDGHIDDLTRFVGKSRVLTVREENPEDPNHVVLEENWQALRAMRDEDGAPLDIVTLPMPEKRRDWQGHRLPCSYANFLVVNGGVLVPAFDDPRDSEAASIIGSVFPGKKVVPVD